MRFLVAIAIAAACLQAQASVPRAALAYRDTLIRNARLVWGLSAPVATFAGQIHQESAWKPDARSRYASGLAQFTPATADWIGGQFDGLGSKQPLNPSWALRALVTYDRWLWDRVRAMEPCERMAMALAAYNGGLGWIYREQRAASSKGLDRRLWFGAVALCCQRSAASCAENRAYPARILFKTQPIYSSWGPITDCGGAGWKAK